MDDVERLVPIARDLEIPAASGPRGRRFKSSRPDHKFKVLGRFSFEKIGLLFFLNVARNGSISANASATVGCSLITIGRCREQILLALGAVRRR